MARTRGARAVMIVLVVLSLALLGTVLWPFASALFVAAVLAGAFYPWQVRLTYHLRERPQLAAGIITAVVFLALVVPVASLGAMLVKEVVDGVAFLRETIRSEGIAGLVARLPYPIQKVIAQLVDTVPSGQQQLDVISGEGTGKAAAAVGDVVKQASEAVVQAVMMLIAFFFLLVDGRKVIDWVSDAVPLKRGQVLELLRDFRKVSVSVLISSAATAGIQAVVALIGYLIASVPKPIFFTLVTFFVAFVPAVGAGGVAMAAALLLFLTGKPWSALFLAIYAVVVIGLVDNLAKPLLMKMIKGGVELHGAIIFFSLVGGLAFFGPVGLAAGPLIVAFFLAVTHMYQRDFAEVEHEDD
jgi:predicted PurR-regulated permease PerM